jgi:hypothetical protein
MEVSVRRVLGEVQEKMEDVWTGGHICKKDI